MKLKADLQQIKDTLLVGRYSLFFGAGANFGAKDRRGMDMPLSDDLRKELIKLKNIKPTSSLARAYALLTQGEIDTHITERFSNCTPNAATLMLPKFLWKRIYTLNVDDCLEKAFEQSPGYQSTEVKTHRTIYSDPNDASCLQLVHTHGWSGRPEDGYVFSLAEYASTMGANSPWTTVLAHTIATEPFIIAGTSLEESDLEYFLAGRQSGSVRRDRGPSFLVEPYPDAATAKECERHGLTLYEGTLEEFLGDLDRAFPARPLPLNAASGLSSKLFKSAPRPKELALFSQDFSYIVAQQARENADLGFYVGRQPTLTDIALSRDISRVSTLALKSNIRTKFASSAWPTNFLIIDDNAGAGKTTIVSRIAYDLAGEGLHIFQYRSLSTPNLDLCAKILNLFSGPFIIICDDFADHVTAIVELYRKIHREDFLILACERSYRLDYVIQALLGNNFERSTLAPFNRNEAGDLISKMDKYGLTSLRSGQLNALAGELTSDPIAIGVCRVLNEFQPIEKIIASLLREADQNRIIRYVACALTSYCYRGGVLYSILAAAFSKDGLQEQFRDRDILPLSYFDPDTRDYVVPTNPVLAQRILREVAKKDQGLMLEVYTAIGAYLAPYVNRQAVMRRTPEARTSGRLFDFDEVVTEFLPNNSEKFFIAMRKYWDWNSRYWEQFALLKLDQFLKSDASDRFDLLSQSISHAKHAVHVERHPLGLTTLGKILLEEMKHSNSRFEGAFKEAFGFLEEAIRIEGSRNRIAIHPYMTIFSGTNNYLRQNGQLSRKEVEALKKHMENAEKLFNYDSGLLVLMAELRAKMR